MSRFPFVAVLLAAAVAVTLTACNSGGSSKDANVLKSSTSSSTTTTAPPATTSTVAPGGACGDQADAITSAVENSPSAGLDQLRGQFTVTNCRIAASNPTFAAASTSPNPGVQLDGATVVLQQVNGVWTVKDVGTSGTGCDLPANVISDLRLSC